PSRIGSRGSRRWPAARPPRAARETGGQARPADLALGTSPTAPPPRHPRWGDQGGTAGGAVRPRGRRPRAAQRCRRWAFPPRAAAPAPPPRPPQGPPEGRYAREAAGRARPSALAVGPSPTAPPPRHRRPVTPRWGGPGGEWLGLPPCR